MTAKQRQAARERCQKAAKGRWFQGRSEEPTSSDLTFIAHCLDDLLATLADVERWKELAKDVVELSHGKNDRWLQAIERALAEDEA